MRSRHETATKTEITPFTLTLPADIDVKPKWSVPVSKNYTAEVYEELYDKTNAKTGDVISLGTEKRYRIIVRHNRTGVTKSMDQLDYNYRDYVYSLLTVKEALGRISRSLMPKKTTSVSTDVGDDD